MRKAAVISATVCITLVLLLAGLVCFASAHHFGAGDVAGARNGQASMLGESTWLVGRTGSAADEGQASSAQKPPQAAKKSLLTESTAATLGLLLGAAATFLFLRLRKTDASIDSIRRAVSIRRRAGPEAERPDQAKLVPHEHVT